MNDLFQYGQKNAQGDLRFIVLHDKGRKPFQVRDITCVGSQILATDRYQQHRFMETALGSMAGKKANEIAGALGAGDIAGNALNFAKNYVGDYLHTF